jgi:hypothetical protein
MRRLPAVLALAAVFLIGAAVPVFAQTDALDRTDALCRKDLHKTLGRLVRESVKEMNKCHTKRLAGQFEPARDCNVPENSPSPLKVVREEAKLRRRAAHSCEGERRTPASPADALGYDSCPAPCAEVPIDATYAGVANCLACLSRRLSIDLVSTGYGTPPLPPADGAKRCQDRIGNLVKKYLSKLMTDQEQCQTAKDRGEVPADTDCRTADLLGRQAKARLNIQRNIERCGAALASLDSCAGDVSGELACILPKVEATVAALFDATYRPIP